MRLQFAVPHGVLAALAIGMWPIVPGAAVAHHDALGECKVVIQSCARDVPRCSHLLDLIQQECRIWRKECERELASNGSCSALADRCDATWNELRALCEPRIGQCIRQVAHCEEM